VKGGFVDHFSSRSNRRRSVGWSTKRPHWSSLSNIFAPPSIYGEYLRWGYPRWFHFVTGSLELTTAVLLARERTRLWGSALGCTVMLAALATVTRHGEYGHGVAPLVVATLSIVVGWIAWRNGFPARYD